jgi:mRNA interferase HigB
VKVLGRNVLHVFAQKHAEVRSQVSVWLAEVEAATWKTPEDVRERYPTVSFVGGNRAVFNIKGNKYRLDATIAFNTGIVQINRAGTHAEYANWTFSR